VARDWLTQGPSFVVVTRGGAGAVAFLGDKTIEVPGRDIKVVDTVGAGDTFSAALLSGCTASSFPEAHRWLTARSGLRAELCHRRLFHHLQRRGARTPTGGCAAVMAGIKVH
jgi:sugar/nucleoside kinase (ribokinase family)